MKIKYLSVAIEPIYLTDNFAQKRLRIEVVDSLREKHCFERIVDDDHFEDLFHSLMREAEFQIRNAIEACGYSKKF